MSVDSFHQNPGRSDVEGDDFDILYRSVSDTDPNSYYRLDSDEYEASMGRDYVHLKEKIGNWGFRLHVNGLHLPPDELETIFKYGLMTWYIERFTELIRVAVSLRTYSDNVKSGKITVKFYDYIRLISLLQSLDPMIRPEIPPTFKAYCRYKNYQLLLKDHGWKHISFHRHLMAGKLMDPYLDFVQTVKDAVRKASDFDAVREVESNGQMILNIELLREMVYSDELRKLGIVFQRWKIVVEKLGTACRRFPTDDMLSDEQKHDAFANLMFYDRFVSRIQELIYLMIKQGINRILEIPDPVSEKALDKPIYVQLRKWIRTFPNPLKPYNESDLLLQSVEYFLK